MVQVCHGALFFAFGIKWQIFTFERMCLTSLHLK
uniref:Uncharacterized protein n=1 Tax=Anguilla anguilla TaxID=7936 RepID=A0A0E9TB37_ANGAN